MSQAISLYQLVEQFKHNQISLSEAFAKLEEVRPLFRRPDIIKERPDGAIEAFSDWEVRSAKLAREMNSILKETEQLVKTDPGIAINLTKLVYGAAQLLNNAESLGKTAFQVGYNAWKIGDHQTAAVYLERASEHLVSAGNNRLRIYALSYQVNALMNLKEYRKALQVHNEFIQIARATGQRGQEALAYRDLGIIYNNLGQHQNALDSHRKAVALRELLSPQEIKLQAVIPLSAFCDELGKTARKAGKCDEAVEAFQRVYEHSLAESKPIDSAFALSEIGLTFISIGETQRGFNYLQRAASLAQKNGREDLAQRWLRQFDIESPPILPENGLKAEDKDAYTLSSQIEPRLRANQLKDLDEALEWLIDWAQHNKDPYLELVSRANLAGLMDKQDETFRSVMKSKTAARLALRIGETVLWVQIQANLANQYMRMGQEFKKYAEDVIQKGLARVDELLQETASTEFRQAIQAGAQRLYEYYVLLLLSENRVKKLIEIAERARARNLTGWISAEFMIKHSALPEELRQHLNTLVLQLRSIEVESEALHFTGDLNTAGLQNIRQKRDGLYQKIEGISSGSPQLVSQILESLRLSQLNLTQLETMLSMHHESAILNLFGFGEGIAAVLMRHDGQELRLNTTFISWKREERLNFVKHLYIGVSQMSSHRTDYNDQEDNLLLTRHIGRITRPNLKAYIDKFRSMFFEEIVRLFDGDIPKYITVIPHRELQLIPYHELFIPIAPDTAVTTAPSLMVFYHCMLRQQPDTGKKILIADMTGTLKYAQQEVDLVKRIWSDEQVCEPKTFEQLVRNTQNATLLHFAAHGLYNVSNPYQSGVVISPDTMSQEKNAQFVNRDFQFRSLPDSDTFRLLTVRDILAKIRLVNSPLVILSACESGLSRRHPADEYTGLPASFLIAGAKTVIATLCPVRDDVALLMMHQFYQHWLCLNSHISPVIALHKARQSVRKKSREDILQLIGDITEIPEQEYPFEDMSFTAPFQAFGAW